MEDEAVYKAGDVVITKTLARFGSTSYPINGIGSVSIAENSKRGGRVFGAIICGILTFISFGSFNSADPGPGVTFGVIFTALTAMFVFGAFAGPDFSLMLRTASGDAQALKSKDGGEVQRIKDAIERAVSLRG